MVTLKRKSYSKISEVMEIPNLLSVQLDSFRDFLQAEVAPTQRKDTGLQRVFDEVFPIADARDNFGLEFVSYNLGEPKYNIDECQERDVTYAAPLKATLRLIVKEAVDGRKEVKDIIEQEVYLGEIPLITDKGTFIINGAERVVVSQLHRSPGVFFDESIHPNGKRLYSARIIPYHGSWVEFSLDVNDIMYVHIDRKRKIPVTVLLRAIGFSTTDDLLRLYYDTEMIKVRWPHKRKKHPLVARHSAQTVVDTSTGEILVEADVAHLEDRLVGSGLALLGGLRELGGHPDAVDLLELLDVEEFEPLALLHPVLGADDDVIVLADEDHGLGVAVFIHHLFCARY